MAASWGVEGLEWRRGSRYAIIYRRSAHRAEEKNAYAQMGECITVELNPMNRGCRSIHLMLFDSLTPYLLAIQIIDSRYSLKLLNSVTTSYYKTDVSTFFFSHGKASKLPTMQVIRRHQKLQAQFWGYFHIRHVLLVPVLQIIVEVLADFFQDDAAGSPSTGSLMWYN